MQSAKFKTSCNSFFRQLNKSIHKCFNKVRLRNHPTQQQGDTKIQNLFKIQSSLRELMTRSSCAISKAMLDKFILKLNETTSQIESESNYFRVKNYLNVLSSEGKLNHIGFWKMRRKLCLQKQEPPMAKRDSHGNLVCGPEALKTLYLSTYKTRLKHRKMDPKFIDIFELKTELWKRRLNIVEAVKSEAWSLVSLEKVLVGLKNNKSADPNGISNELFKNGCIGVDLKIALLYLFNGIKSHQYIPSFMQLSNITSIFKNKGSHSDLENDRGIFILPVMKKILDKLIYNDNYENIDKSMSNSNIGARKSRNIRDHLFVLYGTINSVIKGNQGCIDIQTYDIKKCFDALWLDECMNDLYDTLPSEKKNDQISLLYQANKTSLVAVKTPVDYTERTV